MLITITAFIYNKLCFRHEKFVLFKLFSFKKTKE